MTQSLQPEARRKKCTVYVDGFNWYYGIFVHHPEWKWLNIQGFFDNLRIDEDVSAVNFFTATVDPNKTCSERRDRLNRYLKAIKAFSKVRVILGKYQMRNVQCGARCKMSYAVPEEKKTDVNIAVQILNDAVKGLADSMVLVSGDSDIEPAIQWVRENHPKIKITVYIPCIPEEESSRRNDFYPRIGVTCRFLPLGDLGKYQLPDELRVGDTTVQRPTSWKKS